jgi:hypothetical protein
MRWAGWLPAWVAGAALAGPVLVYREGPEFCPRDRAPSAPVMTEAQAMQRAQSLLPKDFCGPSRFADGCDVLPEFDNGTWRIYVHQFRLRNGRHDWGALTHSYVILDTVGNCVANIPGTSDIVHE